MKKILTTGIITGFALFPVAASAHQHAIYEIGGVQYSFVVGSLNEPIAVDDNTGVDFRVSMVGHEEMSANDHHGEGGVVTGLENSLKVELVAGEKKKTLDLVPTWGEGGSYYAKFYPTVATTLSYRFFGTIEGTPVDLVFTCRADGATAAEEGEKAISDGVKQISKSGGFGCPREKASLGFPEESASVADVGGDTGTAKAIALAALALAAGGFLLGVMRRRS